MPLSYTTGIGYECEKSKQNNGFECLRGHNIDQVLIKKMFVKHVQKTSICQKKLKIYINFSMANIFP